MQYHSVEPWPSKDELDALGADIKRLKQEADNILQELSNFGVDAGLFKLNGD